jgi:hypothetical protein
MNATRRSTALLPRLLALALCAASVLGIVRLAREAGPLAGDVPVAGGDCIARKRAEIEQEKAAGRLTAEQAMIRRQKIKAECG